MSTGWHFWVDRGGTFTDVVGLDPRGQLHIAKLLSDDPGRYTDAAVEGIGRLLTADEGGSGIESVKMGTTVATNALLERRGEPTVLVITAGLADIIRIGTQQRPDIFALDIELPEMLYCDIIEAHERHSASGDVVLPLDEERLRSDLRRARERGINSAAIVFLHGYRFNAHERLAARIAVEAGIEQVSVSHEVSPMIKIVPRGDTTLVDAYLSPVLHRYVGTVRSGLAELGGTDKLLFMQSHGGLIEATAFHGKDSVLSGPAGGVVGMVRTAAKVGLHRLIGFDMGGTSTDVALYDGAYERTGSTTIAGVRITSPMMRIHTVAAGGGSVIKFAFGRLQVGPESAGANPGPVCYRKGGPLTITDANVLLGRIPVERFPRVFGPDGDGPIDTESVRAAFTELADRVAAETDRSVIPEALASGCLRIAVERMANAIKRISVKQGHNLGEFALCCFGGAGGQHACMVADSLGIDLIFVHPLSGVLSAYGMGVADLRIVKQKSVEAPLLGNALDTLNETIQELDREARIELRRQHVADEHIRRELRLHLKVSGSDSALAIASEWPTTLSRVVDEFQRAHYEHYGFTASTGGIAIDSLELELIGEISEPILDLLDSEQSTPQPTTTRRVWLDSRWQEIPIYDRTTLGAGACISGPVIIIEDNATIVVETAWQARVDDSGNLLLTRSVPRESFEGRDAASPDRDLTEPDPVLLEVFNNLFMHIAEQMGIVLENTAHSVNIKERLDFSCAIFDSNGDLIANAPHMPVHLGSMGESVRQLLVSNRETLTAGDVYMSNAPYKGGTHLPDITVATPVLDVDTGRLDFVVASRAHHADVGGVTPGSMPPLSTSIDEEGLVFDNVQIVRDGHFLEDDALRMFRVGPYPARNPEQNIADLKAQIAANARGIKELERAHQRFGRVLVRSYMAHIKRNAESSVRKAISRLDNGRWTTVLDTGEEIRVAIEVDRVRRSAIVDFRGSSPTSPRNFNAPGAIAKSAVLYAFRSLVAEDIPLNAGCLDPISIVLPEDSIVNPRYPAAVVGGNVETSQCITDAIFAALGVLASSQGTMNNFAFGNERHQYYETLCGGAGASANADGATAVHTHMTNSKLTDPEVLEWRFPVRLRRFEVRRKSGGRGRRHGGDGVIREIEFLEPMSAGILSNRRRTAPFGIAGGHAGQKGRNYVIRANGAVDRLAGIDQTPVAAGDRFVIETPGGGGYGRPE